ncbi:phosphate signaling complex protein PhoU [Limisalsivibrio acetivorans]|uniref:phosphate signaling complex protein PhoU n=1 Tax=Limisalsivibrio acetivorans TaxID=1304888 RepID=UPI0003B48FC0|nr:phosphate signaling complex protein PhoU [Limisalsivibrio acetivorans]
MSQHEIDNIQLKSLIAEMAKVTTEMIQNSIKSLVERDSELAKKTINMDEKVDQLDIDIDAICQRILALYEPKAMDLRFVLTASRIIVDLERVGDYCVDICCDIIRINEIPQIKPYIDLPKMGEESIEMLNDAVNAYFNRDVKSAFDVIKRDDYIDSLHAQILRELLTYLAEDMRKTTGIVSLMQITKSFERIADHATNICELVYFMVEGKIVRHQRIEEGE